MVSIKLNVSIILFSVKIVRSIDLPATLLLCKHTHIYSIVYVNTIGSKAEVDLQDNGMHMCEEHGGGEGRSFFANLR